MDLKYKILNLSEGITKDKKDYYKVSLYANWSANVLDCFVSKEVYEAIYRGDINDDNIGECVVFKFVNNKVHLFINLI